MLNQPPEGTPLDGRPGPHRYAPLRIAIVAPPWYELPPRGYGGIEAVCAALADGLVDLGHDVTLFGAGRRDGTRARFVSTTPQTREESLSEELPDLVHAARVNRLLAGGDFDVIHDHSLPGPLTAAQRPAPTVVTVHGPVDDELGDFYAELGGEVALVAISRAQRDRRTGLNWVATIHHAIDAEAFRGGPAAPRRPDERGPVLWLARFTADKGPDLAIRACRAAGLPLVLAGKCSEPAEEAYFEQAVRPLLGDDVQVVFNADRATTVRLLSEARCLIMPIRWPEPFGMVMIEAMAVGTPVVALRHGSAEEIIVPGRTGWLCDQPEELAPALRRVSRLDPADCVRHVAETFAVDLMARRYAEVYREVIAGGPRGAARRGAQAPAATSVRPQRPGIPDSRSEPNRSGRQGSAASASPLG